MENQNDETSSLILDSLEIHNFRAFEHLLIEKLGRVNLIVGKNNVGKTCVLEALQLYASQASEDVIKEILNARDEPASIPDIRTNLGAKCLFHNGIHKQDLEGEWIRIGSKNGVNKSFESTKDIGLEDDVDEDNMPPDVILIRDIMISFSKFRKTTYIHRFGFVSDKGINSEYKIKRLRDITIYPPDLDKKIFDIIRKQFEPFEGYNDDCIEKTKYLLNVLRIIEPNIEDIDVYNDTHREKIKRVIRVRLSTSKTPVLLSSLGEGMNRLLGIALALVNSKDGFLLIDEIDNGIHYSVQPDLWRLIFEGARRMNVQVFATTHSWDCIEAFQQAATESGTNDGMLISLRQKKKTPGHVIGVIFEGKDLEIVTRDRIEVR